MLRLARCQRLIWYRAERLEQPVPVVIPIVLYQGPGPWPSARTTIELLAPAGLAQALARPGADTRLVGEIAPAFLELGRIPIAGLLEQEQPAPALARLALAVLKAEREELDWTGVFRQSSAVVRELWEVDRVGFQEITCYIEAVATVEAVMKLEDHVSNQLGQEAARTFVTAAAHHRGEALRAALARLLTLKFGSFEPARLERIQAAPPDQIQRWLDAFATATTLEQVFAD